MATSSEPSVRWMEHPTRDEASRYVRRLRAFYVHCLAFLIGNAANVLINWITRGSGGNWWFQWPLIVWGLALGVHGLTVVGKGSWLGPAWEERKVRDYLAAHSSPDDPRNRRSEECA